MSLIENCVVIQSGEYRDELDEVMVYGPFTYERAKEFEGELEAQDERIGYNRQTRIVSMRCLVPPDKEVLGEEEEP